MKKNEENTLSHENIYQYVYADKRAAGNSHKHLRCQKKCRERYGSKDRRGKIPYRVRIEQRPESVELRERIGDWDADTILGALRRDKIRLWVVLSEKVIVCQYWSIILNAQQNIEGQ